VLYPVELKSSTAFKKKIMVRLTGLEPVNCGVTGLLP
jgi:hypothetical protein